MAITRLMTADDLAHLKPDEYRYELIRGELRRMSPAGGEHGEIIVEISVHLHGYGRQHGGKVYPPDVGFFLNREPDTVLGPDVAYISADRLPPLSERRGFMGVVPDLVVEVLSPSDTLRELAEKIALYLEAGVPLLWEVNPRRRSVRVHRPGKEVVALTVDDVLDGEEILPGFHLPIADIFSNE